MREYANPIKARDALYGGRVEAFCLSRHLTDEEIIEKGLRIHYLDFVR